MPFAPVAAAAVTAGAGLIGSSMQAGAIGDASSASIAEARRAEAVARADLEPFRTAGSSAVGRVANLSGANGPDAARAAQGDFVQSPGYQWQLGQGLRAVDAGAASKGILRSGATIKAELGYGEGLAKQDFTSYYNRLFDLSRLGENAAAKTGDQSIATAREIGSTINSAGAADASIYGNAAKGITSAVNGLFGDSGFRNTVKGALNGSGDGSGSPSYSSLDPYGQSVAAAPAGGWGSQY